MLESENLLRTAVLEKSPEYSGKFKSRLQGILHPLNCQKTRSLTTESAGEGEYPQILSDLWWWECKTETTGEKTIWNFPAKLKVCLSKDTAIYFKRNSSAYVPGDTCSTGQKKNTIILETTQQSESRK